ncbi:unnamed protein product, partial [Closterium sp. NIES-54]
LSDQPAAAHVRPVAQLSPQPHAVCSRARCLSPRAARSPVAARSLRPRALPVATRSLQLRASSRHTQPAAALRPLLPAACCRLPAACLLPLACCHLPAVCCPCLLPLPPASYLVPAASCLLPAAYYLLPLPPASSFEPDGRPIEFDVWLDDLQLFLLTDVKEGVSLFDYISGTVVTPAADAPALERSQWQTRDAAARLAIRNHLPITERAHFSRHRTAKTLYNAVVARYSSLATAAIGRLMLPYMFPDLSSFTTAEDLVSHLRATDSRFPGVTQHGECTADRLWHLAGGLRGDPWSSLAGSLRSSRRVQREGVDFFHTFSPTPKMTTLRVLLHVATQRDYELHSLDFSTAFLQGSLHEEIWMRRSPGFTGSFSPGTQWSLRRPVYGLRQAPREWHDTLRTTLAAIGFAPSTADPSLFLRTDTLLPPFYVLVYVDDLVFATADTEALALVKSELQKRHTCIDLGELRSYLGLQITRDRARRTITLTQSHMVQQVLQRFGFTWSSAQATLLATGHSLSAPPSDESVEPSGSYPELVGCLMYLMTCTRPDLAYPLGLLARYVAPGRHRKVHMDAAKRVLRYLCSTSGMGLVLGGRGDVFLTGHSDASWVDDLATQRSSQGYTFSLGSGSVSCRSTRSSSVLDYSCEADIYATAMAAQKLRWLTYLLTDLGERPRSPPVLYVDNKAAIALCQEHRL